MKEKVQKELMTKTQYIPKQVVERETQGALENKGKE